MLSDINKSLLLYLLIAIILIAVAVTVGGTITACIKSQKKREYSTLKIVLTTILCIAIAAVSWVFNMGWIRFIMTILLIPFIHAIIFFLVNFFSSKYIQISKKAKNIYTVLCITYLVFYLLLPDGGDTDELYVFFGLIHSNVFAYICRFISSWAGLGHIALLILQTIEIINMRKNNSL